MQPESRRVASRLAAWALLALCCAAAAGQESQPSGTLKERFERLQASHFRKLLESGDNRLVHLVPTEENPECRDLLEAYALELDALIRDFRGSQGIDRVHWEFARTLLALGRRPKALEVLEALDPTGLGGLARLQAASELALLDRPLQAGRLVQGLEPGKLPGRGARILLATLLAGARRTEEAVAALGALPAPAEDLARTVEGWAASARGLPLPLERGALAFLYTEWARRAPDEPAALAAGQRARGLSLRPGDPAPPLPGKTPEGGAIDLARSKGRPVLVLFFDPGVPGGLEPVLQAWRGMAESNPGLALLGVSLGMDRPEGSTPTIPLPGPVIHETQGWHSESAQAYGVIRLPMAFLLDRKGTLIAFGIEPKALEPGIETLLNQNREEVGEDPTQPPTDD